MRVGIREIRFLFDRLRSGAGAAPLLFLIALSACTNLSNRVRAPSSILQTGNPGASSGSFQLVGIVTEPGNGSLYNLIGQGGEFDVYCGGNFGTCQCEYSYSQPSLGVQIQVTPVTYQESNLVRCASPLPAGISSFTVKVTVSGSNGSFESNTLSASFGPGGTFQNVPAYIDVTDPMSYLAVKRYQCRKLEFISSPFDGQFLDPIQSQDPRVIYPFNFYTTNVAESLMAMQQNPQGSQGWDCTLMETPNGSLQWWANPKVFSEAVCTGPFCSGDGELVYPNPVLSGDKIPVSSGSTAQGKRRSTFSLLKKPYGVFQVPVIAATAPKGYSDSYFSRDQIGTGTSAMNLGPLGYAAAAVAGSGGTSSCPNIAIPATARWVKLWSYRATNLSPPRKVLATDASANSPIGCWANTDLGVFDSCSYFWQTAGGTRLSRAISELSTSIPSVKFATRVALEDGGGGTSANPSACYNLPSVVSGFMDQFTPSSFGFYGGTFLTGKVWGRYGSVPLILGSYASNPPGTGLSWVSNFASLTGTLTDPVSTAQAQPVSGSYDNYSDYLFLVTDPSVSDYDMGSVSSGVHEYRPVTYRTKAACSGNTQVGCDASQKIEWMINTKNVNDPNGAEVYPLCVLQFMD